jgi:hypothetical protein
MNTPDDLIARINKIEQRNQRVSTDKQYMNTPDDLIARINKIEQRNQRVSTDKQWETSWTRKISIVILTYLVVLTYLFVIGNDTPWINATVPPIGYLLSTLAISQLRSIWERTNNLGR